MLNMQKDTCISELKEKIEDLMKECVIHKEQKGSQTFQDDVQAKEEVRSIVPQKEF